MTQSVDIDKVVIGERHRQSLGDIQGLAESIRAIGLLHPITVTPEMNLVAGERRLAAFRLLAETDPAYNQIPVCLFNSLATLQAEADENTCRRDFTPSEAVAIGARLEEVERERARERQSEAGKKFGAGKIACANLAQAIGTGKTRDKVGGMVGMGRTTYEKAKKVVQAATELDAPELVEMMDGRSVDAAWKEAKRRRKDTQRRSAVTPLPDPARPAPTLYVCNAENLCIADEAVDIIITSPPYNLGKHRWPMGGEGRKPRTSGIGYDDQMNEENYQQWQIDCLKEWYRVAKNGASLFYNHKVRQRNGGIIHPVEWLKKTPWRLRQEIIWDRGSTHNHNSRLFWPHDERIYWLTKGTPTIPDHGISMPSIWKFHGPVAHTWHPAPFPEDLPERCLSAVGFPGAVILDPFGGSMTTCMVASKLGYISIGVDINQEYIDTARRRNGWMNS